MERHLAWRDGLASCRERDPAAYWTLADSIARQRPTNLAEIAVQLDLLKELIRPETLPDDDLDRLLIVSLCAGVAELSSCGRQKVRQIVE